jgi:hypothetical protein
MRACVQKGLGITLLAGTPVAAGVLYLLEVRLFDAHFESLSTSVGNGWSGGWVGHLSFRWPFFVLMLLALVGLWLLARLKHQKPGA